jgi:uncharacterized protein involved in outer membrane biogenesis
MKTKGRIFLALAVLAAVVAVALYLLLTNLDRIVAAAIGKYGSEATGTKVAVSSVRIELSEGAGSIRGLSVGNPPGFASPEAFRLGDITIDVDAGSVTKDPVVIDMVRVRAPHVTYEINEAGESNIDAIRKHLEKMQGAGGAKGKTAGGGKKIVIRKLIVEDGKVDVRAAALGGKTLSAAIPRIELSNLGGKGGDSPGAVARQIAGSLAGKASLAAASTGIWQSLVKGAGKAGEAGMEAVKDAGEAARKLFGK